MQLIPITAQDEDLSVRLETDPELMRYIGGPRTEAEVRAAHKRRLALMEKGLAFIYKILNTESGEVLGTTGVNLITKGLPASCAVMIGGLIFIKMMILNKIFFQTIWSNPKIAYNAIQIGLSVKLKNLTKRIQKTL